MADDITRDLRAWALRGAEQRLVEIAAEAAAIHRTFPELRDRVPAASGAPAARAAASEPKRGRPGRRGRNLSAEGRQRIAEAARKRWAAWRATQGESEASAPAPAAKGRAPKRR